jgi:glutamate-1-semialdehyde aminotransferase
MRIYEQSALAHERARSIPGHSLTRSKAPGQFFPVTRGPLYCAQGRGAVLVDADGNEFIDMLCGLGAISLGYGVVGMDGAAGVFSLPHQLEGAAAERLLDDVAPWATSVRFVKTGSEATHAAYRVAKRATGRPHVLIGDWAYHGWHEWCEKRLDGTPESADTFLYPYGKDWGENHTGRPQDVAAVFVEPHRWQPNDVEWLRNLRRWCTANGALLVFDEMIYGGRWAMGGATELYGVTPDLACYGKALGNGAAVACVVGSEVLAEHGALVSGTYSGDVTGLGHLLGTLDVYRGLRVIDALWERGEQLKAGLEQVAGAHPEIMRREGAAVHQRLRFSDSRIAPRFGTAMADRGVLWHPACVNVCAAHTREQIDQVVAAAGESMRDALAVEI